MKSMSSLVKSCSNAILGGMLNVAGVLIFGGPRVMRLAKDLPAKRQRNAGWNMRESVANPAACAALVASMDKAARIREAKNIREAASIQVNALNLNKGRGPQIYSAVSDRFELLKRSDSAALFFALAEAGVDEQRVESVAKAFGAPCGAAELDMRLCVLTHALSKHADYDMALMSHATREAASWGDQLRIALHPLSKDEVHETAIKNSAARKALAEDVAPCYLGHGENAALDMAAKLTKSIGSAWVASWAELWGAVNDEPMKRRLAHLAGKLINCTKATPIRDGEARVLALISALGTREIKALIQACSAATDASDLERIKPTLMILHERSELEQVARQARKVRGSGARI